MARTVLIADDSPTVQKKASGILTGEGMEVVTVSNGVAAIKKLPLVRPFLVLADVSMPGKDGYEVCDFVKNSPDLKNVPVLLIVSAAEEYNAQRAAQVRADGKIKKPFDPNELVATAAKYWQQFEASAPKAPPPPTVITGPPPETSVVIEPMDEEQAVGRKPATDFPTFSEGVAFGAPGLEEAAMPPPEPAPAPSMGAGGPSAIEVSNEAVLAEQAAAASQAEEMPISAEPVLVEEELTAAPEAPSAPDVEQTMRFTMPAEIAEPVVNDTVAAEPPPAAEQETSPVAATSLDSFSLTEATAGQVRFAGPEGVVAPSELATSVPGGASSALDSQLVYSIVHRVVVKMSPRALAPQAIEDMARKLADEITAELGQGTPQS